MSRLSFSSHTWLLAGLVALNVTVFILDLLLPLGVAVGMLYVIPIFISLWYPERRHTLVAAMTGTLLAVAGFVFSSGGILWMGVFNRTLTLTLIWATAGVVLLRKRAEEQIQTLEGLIPICAACKKIRNDQGYWDVIELYIQRHSQAQFTHGMCPNCAEQYYGKQLAATISVSEEL
jgi:hypothetical protein